MRVCYCTLGGTAACLTCPNNISYDSINYNFPSLGKNVKIIEKYENGKLSERITEYNGLSKPF